MHSNIPKAACVERLRALQSTEQVLNVICKLLVFSKFHHIIEVLHVLDHSVQLFIFLPTFQCSHNVLVWLGWYGYGFDHAGRGRRCFEDSFILLSSFICGGYDL